MALKSTIYKAALQIADMDRQLYADHALTLALHPSETEERLLVRLLAFALNVPHDTDHGALQFARGLSDGDEPDLWQHDLTGQLLHWIEVGQPDERRLAKACARAERVTLYCLRQRRGHLVERHPQQADAAVQAERCGRSRRSRRRPWRSWRSRSMQWQLTVQDGHVWVSSGEASLELPPQRLMGPA